MKPPLAALAAAALALALPASASAATLAVTPEKRCYRGGQSDRDRNAERIRLVGSGFTPSLPGSGVEVRRDDELLGSTGTDAAGGFSSLVTLIRASGRGRRTYTATEAADPAVTGSATILVSEVDVTISPRTTTPGRAPTIAARGFTTGRALYAHLVRGKSRSTVKVGRLRGACHTLRVRRALIRRGTRPGRYRLQLDTRRRYSPRARVRVRYRFTVRRIPAGRRRRGEAGGAPASQARVERACRS